MRQINKATIRNRPRRPAPTQRTWLYRTKLSFAKRRGRIQLRNFWDSDRGIDRMDKKAKRVPSTTLYMEPHPGSFWLDNLCERKSCDFARRICAMLLVRSPST